MTKLANPGAQRPMVLRLSTAAELMTTNLLSVGKDTPIQKAFALLKYYQLESVPVVDEFDRLTGVVTASACAAWEAFSLRSSRRGCLEELDWTPVFEITSPTTDRVRWDDSSGHVVATLLGRRARRVYVVNDLNELVGVVSTTDVLRHLLEGRNNSMVSHAAATRLT